MPPRSRRRLSLSRRRPRRSFAKARRFSLRRSRRPLFNRRRGVRTTLSGRYAARGQLPGQPVRRVVGRPINRRGLTKLRARVLKAISPTHNLLVTEWAVSVRSNNFSRFVAPGHALLHNEDRVSILATLGGLPNETMRYDISSMSSTVQLSNDTTQPTFVRAYLCKARRDIPNNQSLGEAFNVNVNQNNGYLHQGWLNAPATPADYGQDPAVTLFSNPKFVAYWSIKSVTMHQLAPGEQKEFSISVNKPRRITAELVSDYTYLRGTEFFIFQHWGSVGVQSGEDGGVGLTNSRLDFVVKKNYHFQTVEPNQQLNKRINYLTNTALAVVNVDTAAIQSQAIIPQ